MTSSTGPFYHWSPRSRLSGIRREGLMPGKPSVGGNVYPLGANGAEDRTKPPWRQNSVSASPDPATAWTYLGPARRVGGAFDLWQFWLAPEDKIVRRRRENGVVVEVRVGNRIRKSRLHWIGERTERTAA